MVDVLLTEKRISLKNTAIDGKKLFGYAGTYIMSVIGAGYASGQEFLQYFISYGYMGIIGSILVTLFFAWYGYEFMDIGFETRSYSHGDVLKYLCGRKIGTVFEWILTVFSFCVVAIMLSGSGATLAQYFGVNKQVGTVFMAILTIVTTLFGLNGIVRATSSFAPITVAFLLLISICTIVANPGKIVESGQVVEKLSLSKPAFNFFVSTVIYALYCVLPNVPVIAAIGSEEKDRRLIRISGIIGGTAIGLCIVIVNLAMLTDIKDIYYHEVPVLSLAKQISPILGIGFVFILLEAIYTTAVIVLYGFTTQFAKPGTRKYTIVTIISVIAATFAGFIPFSTLIGMISPVLGYLGLIVLIGILRRHIAPKRLYHRLY